MGSDEDRKIHNDLSNLPHVPQQSHRLLSRVKQGRNNSWRVTRPDCQCWSRGEPSEGSVSLPWQLLPKSFGDSRRSRSFQLGPVSRRHVLEQVGFPSVERPTTDLAALSSRRQTHQRTKPDSAHGPLCGPGAAEAGGYVLIDEPGGLLSISTNYDKRLHVCGISECRCVKLTLINPFVYFGCCCFSVNAYWAIKTWMFHNISGCLM